MLTTGYTGWGLLVLFLSCFGAVAMAVTKEESTAACFGAIICCITIIVGIMFIFNAIPDANVRAPPCPRVCLFTTPAPANVRCARASAAAKVITRARAHAAGC